MTTRNRKLLALGFALMGLVLALLLPQVVVGERTVASNAAATAPGLPPFGPSVTDDPPFYSDNNLPYNPDACAQTGEPHEYTLDGPKESKHSFGPALGQGGADGAIIADTFVRLCGMGGFPDSAVGPDRMFGRALQAAAFGIDPNQPFDSSWRQDLRSLARRIDWRNATVERGVMSAPGTRSMYMYVDENGVTRVGVVEVKPRLGTYLVARVYVDEISYVTLRLRVDCGGQPDLTYDQVPPALLP